MLTVGNKFPDYNLVGVTSNAIDGFKNFTNSSSEGRWKVFFFWPKDFTFVCPTEVAGYAKLNKGFLESDCDLYGISTDSEFVHLAWRNSHPALKDLSYPMLSDIKRELSESLGIVHPHEGVCLRATFIVDPSDIIRHVSVNDLSVGRSPEETLRILEGLRQGGLMPCNWQPGEDALKVS